MYTPRDFIGGLVGLLYLSLTITVTSTRNVLLDESESIAHILGHTPVNIHGSAIKLEM